MYISIYSGTLSKMWNFIKSILQFSSLKIFSNSLQLPKPDTPCICSFKINANSKKFHLSFFFFYFSFFLFSFFFCFFCFWAGWKCLSNIYLKIFQLLPWGMEMIMWFEFYKPSRVLLKKPVTFKKTYYMN